MNTTDAKQGLLGRLRNVATVTRFRKLAIVLHHGLALTGLVAVVLILMRGKALFFDGQAGPSAAIGSIRYDGAISLLDRADDPDAEKYRALANYVSRKYRIAPDATEQFVEIGRAHV